MHRWASCLAIAAAAATLAVASRALAPAAHAVPLEGRALLAELRARAVTERDPVRTELWTWTSEAQVRAIARGAPLLSAHAGDGALRAPYQRALDALQARHDASGDLARALSSRARRYAWTTPYGTAVAIGTRSYGPALIRIAIARGAWHAIFSPDDAEPFRIVDEHGHTIPIEAAAASPERVATVQHVRARSPTGPFREIVVHGGVASFSIDARDARARIAADRRVLAAVRAGLDGAGPRSIAPLWSMPPADDVVALFAQTMPFDTARHRPTPRNLLALMRALAPRE